MQPVRRHHQRPGAGGGRGFAGAALTIDRPALLAGLALLLAAAGPPGPSRGLPGIGTADPRLRVDPGEAPWRAVARLQAPGLMRCTAVFVAPRIAATAAHCLWSPRLGGWVPASAIHLLAGYDAGGFSLHLRAESSRIAPGYDPADPAGTRGADLALVMLAAPAADTLALVGFPPPPGTGAVLGGYNQDRAEVIEADSRCRVTGIAGDRAGRPVLLHDCAATRGTSGGPLLVRAPDGTLALAGIQVAARIAGAGGSAVPAATLRRLLGAPRTAD